LSFSQIVFQRFEFSSLSFGLGDRKTNLSFSQIVFQRFEFSSLSFGLSRESGI